jgi:hypothetical protein
MNSVINPRCGGTLFLVIFIPPQQSNGDPESLQPISRYDTFAS